MSVEFDIVINNKIATKYNHENEIYIEGRKGSEYSLRIKNKSYTEVLVVPTIDGLSIIDGEEADINKSGGYVLSPYQTVDIPGWKLDRNSVASFKFGDIPSSYAAKMNKDVSNVGIIGLAVFYKKVTPVIKYSDPIWNNDWGTIPTYGSFGATRGIQISASSANTSNYTEQSLGTEFGKQKDFKTTSTTFERGTLKEVIEIYYDDINGLIERGIPIIKKAMKPKPSAFPKSNGGCTPPKGW